MAAAPVMSWAQLLQWSVLLSFTLWTSILFDKTEYKKIDYRPRLLSTSGPPAGLEASANTQRVQCLYLPLIIGFFHIFLQNALLVMATAVISCFWHLYITFNLSEKTIHADSNSEGNNL